MLSQAHWTPGWDPAVKTPGTKRFWRLRSEADPPVRHAELFEARAHSRWQITVRPAFRNPTGNLAGQAMLQLHVQLHPRGLHGGNWKLLLSSAAPKPRDREAILTRAPA